VSAVIVLGSERTRRVGGVHDHATELVLVTE
jgi:hypothetical protein